MSSHLDRLTTLIDANTTEITRLAETVKDQVMLAKSLDMKVTKLEATNSILEGKISKLENRIEKLESDKRRSNLLVHGVPDDLHDNPRSTIQMLLTDLGLSSVDEVCDNIYRIGAKREKGNHPRPIMVQYVACLLK